MLTADAGTYIAATYSVANACAVVPAKPFSDTSAAISRANSAADEETLVTHK